MIEYLGQSSISSKSINSHGTFMSNIRPQKRSCFSNNVSKRSLISPDDLKDKHALNHMNKSAFPQRSRTQVLGNEGTPIY